MYRHTKYVLVVHAARIQYATNMRRADYILVKYLLYVVTAMTFFVVLHIQRYIYVHMNIHRTAEDMHYLPLKCVETNSWFGLMSKMAKASGFVWMETKPLFDANFEFFDISNDFIQITIFVL